jgi:hypothetical protein
MVGFIVGGPPEEMELLRAVLADCIGFVKLIEGPEGTALALFEDTESARSAQWILDINGAEGRADRGEPDEQDAGDCHDQPGDWEDFGGEM